MANLATNERLESLVNAYYEGATASPHAMAFRYGWDAAAARIGREHCSYSNVYLTPDESKCYDGAYYVKLYIHWNYGYDAYLFWSQPPEIEGREAGR